MKSLSIFLIRLVSAFFRALGLRACRFHPTCSEYSVSAFRKFGFFKALKLTVTRVGRCHPFSTGGYEPLAG